MLTRVIAQTKPRAEAYILSLFKGDSFKQHPVWKLIGAHERRALEQMRRSQDITGAAGETKTVSAGRGKVFILGLGPKTDWNMRRFVTLVRRAVQLAKSERSRNLALWPEQLVVEGVTMERMCQAAAENAEMAAYEFNRYKQSDKRAIKVRELLLVASKSAAQAARSGTRIGQVVGEAVNQARDLGNIPGGEMTPTSLAAATQALGRQHKFSVTALNRQQLKKLGAGGILGVAKGSSEEPKLIVMEYSGGKKGQAPLVFVGKGVTFDSGGLNLKPSAGINDMHLDMLGGAAVIGSISAIARLRLPVNAVGIVPAIENMPGSAGYRPGDLLKSLSGKTIEVLDTDAEGRIILADALAYAARFKPGLLIDVATLTGACMVALGTRLAGLLTPEDGLRQRLAEVGNVSGDYVWPLPLWDEYEDEVKGTFGDVQNVGKSRYGDAIFAALFLKQFVGKFPWAHLDIAGPMKTTDGQFLSKGASGFGVRFLVELARQELAKT